jgi:hypothetical protein
VSRSSDDGSSHAAHPKDLEVTGQRLEQEIRELKQAKEILKTSGQFLRSGARPQRPQIVAFIGDKSEEIGGEPI